jgi:hypothetical protein
VAARDGLWCQLTAGKSTCMHCVVAGHVVDHISCSCSIAVAELDLSVCPQGVMLSSYELQVLDAAATALRCFRLIWRLRHAGCTYLAHP